MAALSSDAVVRDRALFLDAIKGYKGDVSRSKLWVEKYVTDKQFSLLPYLMCKKREAWETYKRLKSRQLMRAYSRRNSEAGSAVVD